MLPTLTDQQRQALAQRPDRVALVEDDQTHEQFVLIAKAAYDRLVDPDLMRELQIGLDQLDRGEFVEWDPERIKADGRAWLERERMQKAE